jgi:O-antigen biosynthesis protein
MKNYPLVHTSDEKELNENTSVRKQLNLVGKNKCVIDFGCATGYFAHFLKNRGCTVVGVELNPEAAEVAKQHCEQVVVADLDYVSISEILAGQEFDVAVFGDVLEHLRDPWRVLKEVRQLLKPSGYVIASIPNIAHGAVRLELLQGRFEYTEFGILDGTHLRFFTRKTVQDLFEQTGYLIDVIDRTIAPTLSGVLLGVPNVNRESLSDDLIHQVEEAEDSDTLQFIVRAFPASLECQYAALDLKYSQVMTKNLELITQNSELQEALLRMQAELGQSKAELSCREVEVNQLNAQLQHNQTELHQIQTALEQVRELNYAMESSKFWALRKVWVRLKRLIGLGADN